MKWKLDFYRGLCRVCNVCRDGKRYITFTQGFYGNRLVVILVSTLIPLPEHHSRQRNNFYPLRIDVVLAEGTVRV